MSVVKCKVSSLWCALPPGGHGERYEPLVVRPLCADSVKELATRAQVEDEVEIAPRLKVVDQADDLAGRKGQHVRVSADASGRKGLRCGWAGSLAAEDERWDDPARPS